MPKRPNIKAATPHLKVKRKRSKKQPAKTHVYLLLDRSGSMADKWTSTIESINGYVAECAGADDVNVYVTLAAFDQHTNPGVRAVHFYGSFDHRPASRLDFDVLATAVNAKKWQPINPHVLTPRGGTPLYDAVGRLIALIETDYHVCGGDRTIIAIMTDGQENASTEVNAKGAKIGLDRMRARGTQVVFLGSEFNNLEQGATLGGNLQSSVFYASAAAPMAMGAMAQNTMSYARGMSATMDWSEQQRDTLTKTMSGQSQSSLSGAQKKAA